MKFGHFDAVADSIPLCPAPRDLPRSCVAITSGEGCYLVLASRFPTRLFDISTERPNRINPIPGESLLLWPWISASGKWSSYTWANPTKSNDTAGLLPAPLGHGDRAGAAGRFHRLSGRPTARLMPRIRARPAPRLNTVV